MSISRVLATLKSSRREQVKTLASLVSNCGPTCFRSVIYTYDNQFIFNKRSISACNSERRTACFDNNISLITELPKQDVVNGSKRKYMLPHAGQFQQRRSLHSQQQHGDKIERVSKDTTEKMIRVKWFGKEKESLFPYIFLRDNCQCKQCFHPDTKSRLINTFQEIENHITPQKIDLDQTGKKITVIWPDQHISEFSSQWLYERIFPESKHDIQPTTLHGTKPIPWDASSMRENILQSDFTGLMKQDGVLLRHLESLILYGFCIVKHVPLKPMQLPHIAKRMASNLIRMTHYGEVWDVKSKKQPNNLAYTSNKLSLHTDLPYYCYQPSIQMLHCIEQVGGAETEGCNILVDGLHVVKVFKEKYPEFYETLTTVNVRFNDVGKDVFGHFHKQSERPIIGLDNFGNVESIASSIEVRDSFINAPVNDVIKFYDAYYKFRELLYKDEFMIAYKMQPGDALVFDNKRVLHGRTSFNAQNSTRWLQGCYVDWDEVLSTFRVMKGKETVNGENKK